MTLCPGGPAPGKDLTQPSDDGVPILTQLVYQPSRTPIRSSPGTSESGLRRSLARLAARFVIKDSSAADD